MIQKVTAKVKSKKKENKSKKKKKEEEAKDLPTNEIWKLLNDVENSESKNALDLLKLKIELGKKVSIAKNRLKKDNKVFRTYIKENFEERINRIYEAVAIRRANKKGLPPEMGATVLIKVGQGLKAKKQETRDFFKNLVEAKRFEIEGTTIDLIPANRKQLLAHVREFSSTKSTPKILPKVDLAIVNFRDFFDSSSNEERLKLISKIDIWIKELSEMKNANSH